MELQICPKHSSIDFRKTKTKRTAFANKELMYLAESGSLKL